MMVNQTPRRGVGIFAKKVVGTRRTPYDGIGL